MMAQSIRICLLSHSDKVVSQTDTSPWVAFLDGFSVEVAGVGGKSWAGGFPGFSPVLRGPIHPCVPGTGLCLHLGGWVCVSRVLLELDSASQPLPCVSVSPHRISTTLGHIFLPVKLGLTPLSSLLSLCSSEMHRNFWLHLLISELNLGGATRRTLFPRPGFHTAVSSVLCPSPGLMQEQLLQVTAGQMLLVLQSLHLFHLGG